MNHFMDYVCRGIVRSEDAIRCLNKRTIKLAKCNNRLSTAVLCLSGASICMLTVLLIQDNEIKALKNQVDELTKDVKDVEGYAEYVASTVEEQNQQKGA